MRTSINIIKRIWMPIILIAFGLLGLKYAKKSLAKTAYLVDGSRADIIVLSIEIIMTSVFILFLMILFTMTYSIKHEAINTRIKYKSNLSRVYLEFGEYSITSLIYTVVFVAILLCFAMHMNYSNINWSTGGSYFSYKMQMVSDLSFVEVIVRITLTLFVDFELVYIYYNIIYHLIGMKVVSIIIEFVIIKLTGIIGCINLIPVIRYKYLTDSLFNMSTVAYYLLLVICSVALMFIVSREEYKSEDKD